jgi:DNA mismatch repair protein MSH6
MAPSKLKPQENVKQKSLISFFGKKPEDSNKPGVKSIKQGISSKSVASKSHPTSTSPRSEPKTPESKGPEARILSSSLAKSSRSSDGGLSEIDTPPTSDPVDIEMLSSVEENQNVQVKPVSYCGDFFNS